MNAENIIKTIAKQDGVSPEYVKEEMKKAIREAMSSDDPEAIKIWKQITPNGDEPEIAAFLDFCAGYCQK